MRQPRHVLALAVPLVLAGALATGCGTPQQAAGSGSGGAPVRIGLVYSRSGPLASYGREYLQGFTAGLDYATNGSGKVGGRSVQVTQVDDAGDPAKAVAGAKDLIGKGYRIIGGSTASGVALQVAAVAEQNKVLDISGPAATDAITGAGRYTFRSGRQTWQDIRTAAASVGDVSGRKVTVFAQDSAFGQANVAAVRSVLGGAGARVDQILVPESTSDFTPFATKARDARPALLFVAWAGTTAQAMWTALGQQGVFGSTTVVTGLDTSATWLAYGPVRDKISFLAHYFAGAAGTDVEKAMTERVTRAGGTVDLFTVDGFTAAQMVVHAARSGDSADGMVKALEGWRFDGVKGPLTVRADDHALLQPMFTARLTGDVTPRAQLVKVLPAEAVAPPVAAQK